MDTVLFPAMSRELGWDLTLVMVPCVRGRRSEVPVPPEMLVQLYAILSGCSSGEEAYCFFALLILEAANLEVVPVDVEKRVLPFGSGERQSWVTCLSGTGLVA